MPNIWAHIQYGREMLDTLGLRPLMEAPAWRRAFQFGCQGPDFLFYHNFLPWQPHSDANRLGTLLHNANCGPFLLDLFGTVRGKSEDDEAFAYALGFLLHHVLDRHLHPLVFSLSGFRKWHHQRFETAMDWAVMKRRAGIDVGRTPLPPELDTGGELPGGLAAPFRALVARHYPALADRVPAALLNEAVRHMLAAQRLFYDPRGWKAKLLCGQIDPFTPLRRAPAYDVLNESKRPWIDPVDRTVRHTASAMELWDDALADGARTAAAGIRWQREARAGGAGANGAGARGAVAGSEEERLREAFAAEVGNVSYETGLPCGSGVITYAEPIM